MSTALVAINEPRPAIRLLKPIAEPQAVIDAQNAARHLVHEALVENRDYGKIPGTDKPTMLKPGAERVALGFGCYYGTPEIIASEIDHDREVQWTKRKKVWNNAYQGDRSFRWDEESGVSRGLYRYVVRVPVIERATGETVGSGVGACSTMESKYIDRPRDAENTALKMAYKRAMVAACLTTFGLSDEFTQDVEDLAPASEPAPAPRPEGNRRAAERQASENTHAQTLTLDGAMQLVVKGKKLGEMSVEHLESLAKWQPKKPSNIPAAAQMILDQLAKEADPAPTTDDERVAGMQAAENANQSDLPF